MPEKRGTAGSDAPVAVTSAALTNPPEPSGCSWASHNGHEYWLCRNEKSWSAARTQCTNAGMDLATVNDVAENTFLNDHIPDNSWIGGNDQTLEGDWRWVHDNSAFWSGGPAGCPSGSSLGPNGRCFKKDSTLRTRSSAASYCAGLGSGWGLAKISSSSVNSFLFGMISGTSSRWVGANDITLEGKWRWRENGIDDGAQFWQGGASGTPTPAGSYANWEIGEPNDSPWPGDCARMQYTNGKWADTTCNYATYGTLCEGPQLGSPVGGLYSNWATASFFTPAEPDNAGGTPGEDCAFIDDGLGGGTWRDESCTVSTEYVCESTEDLCPGVAKNAPGQCGCAVPDTDTDADGTADCVDLCPNDASKIAPGDCGCSNAPASNVTPCDDGLCAANTTCNGAGVCGNPQDCAPDAGCVLHHFRGFPYWFCGNDTNWNHARSLCQMKGMDLTHIESTEENAFIRSKLTEASYIGATDADIGVPDPAGEGVWRWVLTQVQFWEGDETGGSIPGQYSNWGNEEPNAGSAAVEDCAEINTSGDWNTEDCTSHPEAFVCELVDLCPTDPDKTAPGQCDCGVPDTDSDNDGTADCIDMCPFNPLKTESGECGCGALDTDTDNDETADCNDRCPNDANRSARPCSPDTDCTLKSFGASDYFFCDQTRDYGTAKANCETVGLKLARVDGAAENAYIEQQIGDDHWIGGSDIGTEGTWVWEIGGDQFWQGAANGTPVGGLYSNWTTGEPDDSGGNDECLLMLGDGHWSDDECGATRKYICETPVSVSCPGDVIHDPNGTADQNFPLMGSELRPYLCDDPSASPRLSHRWIDVNSWQVASYSDLTVQEETAFHSGFSSIDPDLAASMAQNPSAEFLIDVWFELLDDGLPSVEDQVADPEVGEAALAETVARIQAGAAALQSEMDGREIAAVRQSDISQEMRAPVVRYGASFDEVLAIGQMPSVWRIMPRRRVEGIPGHDGEFIELDGANVLQGFGYDGSGVTVGIMESGVVDSWAHMSGAPQPLPLIDFHQCGDDFGVVRRCHCSKAVDPAQKTHGRYVSGTIRNDQVHGGVAQGAITLLGNYNESGFVAGTGTCTANLLSYGDTNLTSAVNWLLRNNATIVNWSYASDRATMPYLDYVATVYPRPTIVSITSNGGLSKVSGTRLRNGLIVGGGVDNDSTNRADVTLYTGTQAKNFRGWELPHIAAIADKVASAGKQGLTRPHSDVAGTSFAAPQVSGIAADLQEANPQVKNVPEAMFVGLLVGADEDIDGRVWPLNLHDQVDDKDGVGLINGQNSLAALSLKVNGGNAPSLAGYDWGEISSSTWPAGYFYPEAYFATVPAGYTLTVASIVMAKPTCGTPVSNRSCSAEGGPFPRHGILIQDVSTDERVAESYAMGQNYQFASARNTTTAAKTYLIALYMFEWVGPVRTSYAVAWLSHPN